MRRFFNDSKLSLVGQIFPKCLERQAHPRLDIAKLLHVLIPAGLTVTGSVKDERFTKRRNEARTILELRRRGRRAELHEPFHEQAFDDNETPKLGRTLGEAFESGADRRFGVGEFHDALSPFSMSIRTVAEKVVATPLFMSAVW